MQKRFPPVFILPRYTQELGHSSAPTALSLLSGALTTSTTYASIQVRGRMCVRSVASPSRTLAACVDTVRCTLVCGLIPAPFVQSRFHRHPTSNRSVQPVKNSPIDFCNTSVLSHQLTFCFCPSLFSNYFSVSSMNAPIRVKDHFSAHIALKALHTLPISSSTFALTPQARILNAHIALRNLSCTPTCRGTSVPMAAVFTSLALWVGLEVKMEWL